METGLILFLCWFVIVMYGAAFFLGLANKWGWIEWLQVHAPNQFFNKLFNCKFCCSWWMSVLISLILCIATGHWYLIFIPVCSTPLTKELW